MITQCEGMTLRGTRCRKPSRWIIADATIPSSALRDLDSAQLAKAVYAACDRHSPKIAAMLQERTGVQPRVTPDFDVDEFAAYWETGGICP